MEVQITNVNLKAIREDKIKINKLKYYVVICINIYLYNEETYHSSYRFAKNWTNQDGASG